MKVSVFLPSNRGLRNKKRGTQQRTHTHPVSSIPLVLPIPPNSPAACCPPIAGEQRPRCSAPPAAQPRPHKGNNGKRPCVLFNTKTHVRKPSHLCLFFSLKVLCLVHSFPSAIPMQPWTSEYHYSKCSFKPVAFRSLFLDPSVDFQDVTVQSESDV